VRPGHDLPDPSVGLRFAGAAGQPLDYAASEIGQLPVVATRAAEGTCHVQSEIVEVDAIDTR